MQTLKCARSIAAGPTYGRLRGFLEVLLENSLRGGYRWQIAV